MIEKSQLEEMFAQMKAETDWNLDESLIWGFYFTDADLEKLERAAVELETRGYDLVEIFEPELEEGEELHYVLHVERFEPHSVETLHARNQELTDFATQFGLAGYDGMDVGAAGDEEDDEWEDDEDFDDEE